MREGEVKGWTHTATDKRKEGVEDEGGGGGES